MSNDKQELVPRLRFPEFRGTGGWEEKPLGQLLVVGSGKDYKTLNPGKIPVYGSGGYMLSVDQHLYDGDSVCIGRKGTIDRPLFLTGKFWTVDTLFYTHSFRDCIPKFIYAVFQQIDWQRYCEAGGIPSLSKTNIEKIPTCVPSLSEQQKISACLSSLDDLITAETKTLDTLRVYKKGLMQQLFPQEGETVPRLRFPEFRGAGEWVEVALGDIADIKLGKMLDGKSASPGKLLPYLNNQAVRWNEFDTSELPTMYFEDDELERFGLRAGDVLVCEGGEPGRSSVWDGRLPEVKFQKALHRVRFNAPFEPLFLVLFLELLTDNSRFEGLFTGGGIKHLTRETFVALRLPIPSHTEQREITGLFTELNNRIAAQAQKIDALKTHKKGLMQGLFPKTEEGARGDAVFAEGEE